MRKEGQFQSNSDFQVSVGNIFGVISFATNYLAQNDITFTEEEIKDFLERHSPAEGSESASLVANSTTSSIKDYLLLTFGQEQAKDVRNGILLKYLAVCHPILLENFPLLKEGFEAQTGM